MRDLHGYSLRFGHRIYNAGPGLEIERVDVQIRLEKRLAAVLSDLRHIQDLKEKHGLDYDSHASYRFVERK